MRSQDKRASDMEVAVNSGPYLEVHGTSEPIIAVLITHL